MTRLAKKSERARWVKAMHVAAIHRHMQHLVCHPKDRCAWGRMVQHMDCYRQPHTSPWWEASSGLHIQLSWEVEQLMAGSEYADEIVFTLSRDCKDCGHTSHLSASHCPQCGKARR